MISSGGHNRFLQNQLKPSFLARLKKIGAQKPNARHALGGSQEELNFLVVLKGGIGIRHQPEGNIDHGCRLVTAGVDQNIPSLQIVHFDAT